MKKILAILLTVGMAVSLVGCKNDDTAGPELQFYAPELSDVSATVATVTFPVSVGDRVLSSLQYGVLYGLEDQPESEYLEAESVEVGDRKLRCHLTGLESGRTYRAFAFAAWGATRIRSEAAAFTTEELIGELPVVEVTSLMPLKALADGGECRIEYLVHNPVEGVQVSASCPATWVHSFENIAEGVIVFRVDANPGAQERRAVVGVAYEGASPVQAEVVQAAAEQTPPQPGEELLLTPDSEGWPAAYGEQTVTLGGHRFHTAQVAIFNADNGIQFKSGSGAFYNLDDMAPISRIELVYNNTNDKNIRCYVGAAAHPTAEEITPSVSGDTYTFDCSGTSGGYFTLENGSGVSYLRSIRIVCGGEAPDPEPGKPSFGTPYYSNVTQESAAIGCSIAYNGDEPVSQLYFVWRGASGAEQHIDLTPLQAGEKSARLTGLAPATFYTFRLEAVIGGQLYRSDEKTFRTLGEGGNDGAMPYPGWAELPLETEKPGDYHYMHKFSDGARNYTVCYSETYHCAVWTAHPMHKWYTEGSAGRASFGYDPEMDRSLQPLLSGTYSPSTYHRGHMVASSDRQRSKAMNKQVFYYTNMAPQIQNEFNGGIWNKLERKIQSTYICSDTLYVVTGSYFGDPSKTCKDTPGEKTVVVPTHFYKVLLRSKSGNTGKPLWELPASELKCYCFWFEHSYKYGTTGTPTRNEMISVEEAERLTQFTFFPNVPNAPKGTMDPSEWGM